MSVLRIGVVGLGAMGTIHAALLRDGRVPGAMLSAVADPGAQRRSAWTVPGFADAGALAASGSCDAAVVATPHLDHPASAGALIRRGLHVLIEKPATLAAADGASLIRLRDRQARPPLVAVNHMQRSDPAHRWLRDLIAGGGLGRIQRAHWTATDWFRSDAYFRGAQWRGTWSGEGGGLLVNQLPHQLDLLCWLLGRPLEATARLRLGGRHPISVEDEVVATVAFADGAWATIAASTGEAPGVNRLEIAGSLGLVVLEGGRITWTRNQTDAEAWCRSTSEPFAPPPSGPVEVPVRPWSASDGRDTQHLASLSAFAAAVRGEGPPLATLDESMHAVGLANGILVAGITGRPSPCPPPPATFTRILNRLKAGERKRTAAAR